MKHHLCAVQAAMRRAGHNPTDIEVLDIINKIDNETGGLDFEVKDENKLGQSCAKLGHSWGHLS